MPGADYPAIYKKKGKTSYSIFPYSTRRIKGVRIKNCYRQYW